MRPLRAAILSLAVLAVGAASAAEPTAAPGYHVETINVPGAMFSGLSRDSDALLVTNLGDGRLYRRGADGALVAFGPALPHGIDVIGDPTGPYRAIRVGDLIVVAQGWTPVDGDEGPFDHALVAIDQAGQATVINGDFWNPFDFAVDGDNWYVVDAAANSIERIAPDGSGKTTLFTFARINQTAAAMQALSPTEFAEAVTYDFDAVPTGVALRDGRLYVSLFGGFPFLPEAGKVMSIAADVAAPSFRLEFEKLNAPVDVAFDFDGRLLVLEHGLYDQASGFRSDSGRLLGFDIAAGERKVILDGLTRPASVLAWDATRLVIADLAGNLHFLTRDAADHRK